MKQALAAFFTLALLILADAATLAGATIPCRSIACGFIYSGGTWTLIESIGGNSPVSVHDINNAGQIVGHLGSQGFVYGTGKLTLIDVPSYSTDAFGINDAGQVTGTFWDREVRAYGGFLYDDGLFTTIHMPGALATFATGLNDSGQIVGIFNTRTSPYTSFLYTAGTYTMISSPGRQVLASDINNSGQIAGRYVDSRENQGFLYDAGTFTTIDPPGQVDTLAFGINNSGQIVSWYGLGGKRHGYLYDHGTYTTIDFPGASATLPYGINDSGQIVGTVIFFPEPASVILLAGGLGAILVLRLQVLKRRASNTGRGEQR